MSTLGTISPTEEELATTLRYLRESHPTTGVSKLLVLLRETRPEWSVSEKRLRKVLQQEGLMISSGPITHLEIIGEVNGSKDGAEKTGHGPATTTSKAKKSANKKQPPRRLYPTSRADSQVDVSKWTEKVAIRHFDAVKGKGLVATAHIEGGEIVWKEDPWVLTADWTVYSGTVTGNVCTHCSCPLSLRNASSILTCPHCTFPTNQYCNRLCYSRAQASYHPFLCEGQNPACKELLKLSRASEWAAPHALGRATGKMMAEWRNRSGAAGAGAAGSKSAGSTGSTGSEGSWEESWAFFEALAGWNLEDKYRCEGKEVSAAERELWKKVYECYVQAFHQPPTAEGRNKLQQVMRRKTLPPDIISKLFTYDSFMLNVGRVDVNRESHGGLYQLHSHMNHSCEPNIAVLHIDVPGSHTQVPHLPPYTGTPVPSRLTLLAKRPIYPGEELTVSYVSPLLGLTERRRELRQWGIEHCQCSKCMQEEKEPEPEGVPELDEGRKRELADLEAELRQSFGFGL